MKHLKFWAILLMMVTAATLSGCSSSRNASDAKQISYKDVGSHKSKKGSSKKSNDSSKSSGSLSGISKKLGVQVTSSDNQKLYSEAASWVGAPYKYGGTSRSGVDCSGFTYLMYKSVYGKTISRQSGEILSKDCNKIKKSDLRAGDLVFFRTDGKRSSTPNHVGIYLKSNKFIHASSSKGVVVSDLTTDYYVKNWIAGGRVR